MADECRRLAGSGGKGGGRTSDRGGDKISTISMLSNARSIVAINRWRIGGNKAQNKSKQMSQTAPRLSCDSQQPDGHNEITYVPTSALKSAMAVDRKNGAGGENMDEGQYENEHNEEDKVMC